MNYNKWSKTLYGWKKLLSESSQFLIIEPGKNTDMGAAPERIGPYGLKSNEVAWEHVEHLGTIDQPHDDEFTLLYTFLPQDHRSQAPIQMKFRKNGRFYSVLPDERRTGFYHRLSNISASDIRVKICWKPV